MLLKMIEAGMDVARLNFSHGTHADHQARIVQLRELSKKIGKPLTILQDLQGPKLRIGELPGTGLDLKTGDTVLMSSVGAHSSALEKGILYPSIFLRYFRPSPPGDVYYWMMASSSSRSRPSPPPAPRHASFWADS
jgi:hypothetical protein